MPNPFDAASKGLIDADPIAWLRLFGLPGEGVYQVLDLRESSTYQEILEEGRAIAYAEAKAIGMHKGKKELLAIQLEQRFSTLSESITSSLDKLTLEQMNELGRALFGFASLADLEEWLANR